MEIPTIMKFDHVTLKNTVAQKVLKQNGLYFFFFKR